MAIAVYLVLCVLVGFLAIGLRGGFFLYFILSLALSPLVGLMILVIVGSSAERQTSIKFPRY